MNPGYAGRSVLPESVKALFRSCAMVIPDVGAILRVRLFTLGFESSARLSQRVEHCLQVG
jgi:dynein heavy chain